MECCPQHTELWLALARLSTHEEARKILNKAGDDSPDTNAVLGHDDGVPVAALQSDPSATLYLGPNPAPSASTLDTPGAASGADPDSDPVPSLVLTLERLWKAREEIPADPTIWFAAAKLEEAQGNAGLAATIINRAPAKLRKNNGVVSRDDWLKVRPQWLVSIRIERGGGYAAIRCTHGGFADAHLQSSLLISPSSPTCPRERLS